MKYTTTSTTRSRHILPGMLFALMLMAAPALQAQTANGYVIYCEDYGLFLAHDASGNVNTAGVSTFDPATCLWAVGTYIRPTSANGTTVLNNLYLCPRNGNNSYTLNTSNSNTYRAWGGGLSDGGQPYYGTRNLRVTGGTTWQVGTGTDRRGTVYAVSKQETEKNVAAAYAGTLSGATELIGAGATSTVTPTATYTAAHTLNVVTYTYNGGEELGSTTTGTVPTPTAVNLASGWTLSWSLSDDTYATISDDGVVTVGSTLPATYATTTVTLTATRTDGTGSFSATMPLTIYASAAIKTNVVGGTQGISGGIVTLNDYEDHSWSYYSDATLPARMRSLNPANVVIKYYGNGTNTVSTNNNASPALSTFTASTNNSVAVGIDEPESTFVYYKTLERTSGSTYGSASYNYTTIPNPFSIRPTYGTDATTRWRGFYAWRIKSINGGTISGKAVGDTIDAEATVSFIPTAEYGMTVELEALWARAYVNTGLQASVSRERNFIVVSNDAGRTLDDVRSNNPCTYSSFYPDGTTNGTETATLANRNTRRATFTPTADSKIEYMLLNGNNYDISANAHNLTLGRGIGAAGGTNSCNNFSSINSNQTATLNFTARVESGVYNRVYLMSNGNTISGRVHNHLVFGSDYDRAAGDNSKLSVAQDNQINFATPSLGAVNKDQPVLDIEVKSGEYQRNYWYDNNTSAYNFSFYCHSTENNSYPGLVSLTVEGGHFANINGGRGSSTEGRITPDSLTFSMRFKGGTVENSIYGAASNNPTYGSRRLIFTGGEVKGWVVAGCNGTGTDNNAYVTGNSYIYVGGNMKLGNASEPRNNNGTPGGSVYGAGRGNDSHRASITNSHVAVADKAEILENVFGGGFHGYITDTSNVFVLGGTVHGRVYGGGSENGDVSAAIPRRIPIANVIMTGGVVEDGVYGGSYTRGIVSNQVNVQINGGQVGTSSSNANVHGGGYGPATTVNGNVNVTLGNTPANTGGATVYGNVYGGSALGDVNTNGSNTTIVTLNRGTVNGNVFGGALGVGADVHGKISVDMKGGTVNGNVYGGGDEAAYSPNSNHPVVQQTGGTAGNVFGGGRGETAVVTGNPQVTLSGTAHVKGNVFGGGHAAAVTGNPHVTIQ